MRNLKYFKFLTFSGYVSQNSRTATAVSADSQTQLVMEEQALQLTERYVTQHYGNQTAQAQKPYQIKREGEYWIITGKPPKALGGNFRVVLGERGKLEKITHTK